MHNDRIINLTNMSNGEFRFVRVGKNNDEELLVYMYNTKPDMENKYIVVAKLDRTLTKDEQKGSYSRLVNLLGSSKYLKNREYSDYFFQDVLNSPVGKVGKFTKEGYDLLSHKYLFNDNILERSVYVYIDPEKHNEYGPIDNNDRVLFKPLESYRNLELTHFEINLVNLKGYLKYHFQKVKDFCIQEGPESKVNKLMTEYIVSGTYRKSASIKENLINEVLMLLDAKYERKINEQINNEQVK